jgi:hypothetical protein
MSLVPVKDISQTRCCIAQGCFDCDDYTTYETTYPLLTFFYRQLGPSDGACYTDLPEANYTPYDIFCLETKLQPILYQLDPSLRMGFSKKELQGVMRLTIDLYKGADFFPLTQQQASNLQREIDYWQTKYPEHCLVLDARVPMQEGASTYPQAWVASMVRFLDIDCCFGAIVEEGRVYINLKDDVQYMDRHFMVYKQIRTTMQEYFERGIVPLSPRLHADVIRRWELEIVNELPISPLEEAGGSDPQGGLSEADRESDLALYEPLWKDASLADSRVDFIYKRLAGDKRVEMTIGANYMRRHAAAHALKSLKPQVMPIFFRDRALFPAETIEEATRISHHIKEAIATSTGLVEIIPIDDMSQAQKIADSHVGAIVYRVLDQPQYILSFPYSSSTRIQPQAILTYVDQSP